jgi:hypothetical protein
VGDLFSYRIYLRDSLNMIVSAYNIRCAGDEIARAMAQSALTESGHHAVELWERTRRVCSYALEGDLVVCVED